MEVPRDGKGRWSSRRKAAILNLVRKQDFTLARGYLQRLDFTRNDCTEQRGC